MTLVADTSALISLGCADTERPSVVDLFFERFDVLVPRAVVEELREMAAYEDRHGRAAETVLEQDDYVVDTVTIDPDIPLDEGENAVVSLANQREAEFCYCDEFNRLAIVHASLVNARLVTTPRLLEAFVVRDDLSREEAASILDTIGAARSWEHNSYVQQSRKWFIETND